MYFLIWLSDLLGITYQALNVVIFCFINPALIIFLLIVIMKQKKRIEELSNMKKITIKENDL